MEQEFHLFNLVERLAPEVFAAVRGNTKTICANVDFYSGLVYRMLRIPDDLFTPMFAIARVPGWCAHRIEEITTNGRIIRPAYRSLSKRAGIRALGQKIGGCRYQKAVDCFSGLFRFTDPVPFCAVIPLDRGGHRFSDGRRSF